MYNALQIIRMNIATWWNFMWETEVPGTGFSFGALYGFLIMVSLFLFVVGIGTRLKYKEDDK